MALATETDPVETIRLILDPDEGNTPSGDWATVPDHVEVLQATDRETKKNRAYNQGSNAVYVWSPVEGEFPQWDAAWDYEDLEVVQCDCWGTSASVASSLAGDIRSILFTDWVRDNNESTAWNEIAPINENDQRGSTPAGKGNKVFIVSVQIRLSRLVEP